MQRGLPRNRRADTATRRSILTAVGVVAAFALPHSLLASRAAKRGAGRVLGERYAAGVYRAAYNALAAVGVAGAAAVIWRLPSGVPLYRVEGPPRLVLHAGQLLAAGAGIAAVRQIGFAEFLGLRPLRDLAAGQPVDPAPEAQHPRPRLPSDDLGWHGPYRLSSHPANLLVLPAYWLVPRMTPKWLAVASAVTVYMTLGSLHEDARLRAAYGARFRRYHACTGLRAFAGRRAPG